MGKAAASATTSSASAPVSSSSSSSHNDPSDNKHEQRLQAVLLADTFSDAFHPITLEPYYSNHDDDDDEDVDDENNNSDQRQNRTNPAARTAKKKGRERPLLLCPLNNVPLVLHTIDFLQGNGVEELYVLCASGAEALEEYIRRHAEGGGSGGGMKSNNNLDSRASVTSSNVDGGSAKIAWSSKLMISIVRITDCTNAGE